jgi:hypothetical protein
MEIEIEDPRKWLSKRQRQKIRSYCMENQENIQEQQIMELIVYRENEGPYTTCTKVVNGPTIKFVFHEEDKRENLRAKLAQKINRVRGKRSYSALASWRRYYDLANHPQLSTLPTPPDIVKNKEQYDIVKNMDKTGWLKDYIDLCLSEEKDLLNVKN